MKRYGALFTCLASRAVHIEVVASMEMDSFIMALWMEGNSKKKKYSNNQK